MATVSGVTVFDRAWMQAARYFYERAPFTLFDGALASGATPVVNEPTLAPALGASRIAILSRLAATTAAGVVIQLSGPKVTYQNSAAAFPPNLEPLSADEDGGEHSTSVLRLTVVNTTGQALTSGFALSYHGAVKSLSLAEKIQRGLPLTAAEQALADQYHLTADPPTGWHGLRPLSLREQIDLLFRRAILDEDFQTFAFPPLPANTPQTFLTVTPNTPGDELLIWHVAGGALAPADVGTGVLLTVNRDSDQNRAAVLLDSASPVFPWRPWVVAENTLSFTVTAQTGTANPVAVRVGWYRCKLTPLLRAALGLDLTTPDAATLRTLVQTGVL